MLIAAIVVTAAVGTGYFLYRYANPVAAVPSPVSSSVSARPVSSAAALPPRTPALQAARPAASSAAKTAPDRAKASEAEKIRAEIDLDWKKYALKPTAAKTIGKKKYNTYNISDEDGFVGPVILVDPAGGAVYTWVASDPAPVPAAADKAFDKTVRTVTGIVEDGAMMSVVLKTDAGNELVVRRLGVDTSGLTSLKIGDRIKVTYTGVISGNDTTRAFIAKLENVP